MNDALHSSNPTDPPADSASARPDPGRSAAQRPTWASQMAAARKVLEAYVRRRAPAGGTASR